MDARSAQLQQELKERDAEIKGLQTEQRVRDKTTMQTSYSIIIVFLCTGSDYFWRRACSCNAVSNSEAPGVLTFDES